MAVSCCPIIARVEGLDRTAVSISVPSTMLSERLVKLTNCIVSPGWKVTTWPVIGVKSASPEVNVGIVNHSWFNASFMIIHLVFIITNLVTLKMLPYHTAEKIHDQQLGSCPQGGTRQVDIVSCGFYAFFIASSSWKIVFLGILILTQNLILFYSPAVPTTVERDTKTGTSATPSFTTLSLVEPPSATM